jgi:ABC-2 type transport system ATP-binding protein
MADDVIVAHNLVVRYRGKAALDGLDLLVPRGAVYAFLGDNGAGKTTTMKVLTGLAPADAGRAEILGRDCWACARELRHRVGYVPERPRFYDWMTVADIGWFTASFHKPGFLPRYREWADRLGLDPAKRLKDLSKGGYARVGLALALAPDPEVLLLDEPTSGLDLLTRREFLASLVDLAAAGRTVLISSHSIAELERACTHVGLLRDGKMILSSTLDELRKTVRRISLRFADRPPDPAGLGTVLERNGTGRFWQVLVQGPDPGAVAALRQSPGVSDFEDAAVSLEEVYAALMARSANGAVIPTVRKVEG